MRVQDKVTFLSTLFIIAGVLGAGMVDSLVWKLFWYILAIIGIYIVVIGVRMGSLVSLK